MTYRCMHRVVAMLSLAFALALIAPQSAYPAAGPGQTCGGIIGIQCNPGLFCQKPTGRCFILDLTGTCTRIPHVCTKIFRPVCGCDGKTYSNDCVRQAARVSKAHNGRCTY